MRTINLIVVHCSASRINAHLTPERLEEMHRRRGFHGCGYHYYIRRDGMIYAMRPLDQVGAHAKDYNAHSIGICYEGGLNADGKACDTRTPEQKKMLRTLISRLKLQFDIKKVVGHRDLSPDLNRNGVVDPEEWMKMCPCFDVASENY